MLDWEELERQCLACQRCGLAETRRHVVFGTGPRDAEVMCIGEGPGENEDLQGLPFVGRGGKLLDEMLELIDLSQIIICLGRIAAMRLIKPDFKISKEHGSWFEKSGVHMTAVFHPAAILRNPAYRPDTFVDLKGIQAKVREVCTHTY